MSDDFCIVCQEDLDDGMYTVFGYEDSVKICDRCFCDLDDEKLWNMFGGDDDLSEKDQYTWHVKCDGCGKWIHEGYMSEKAPEIYCHACFPDYEWDQDTETYWARDVDEDTGYKRNYNTGFFWTEFWI